MRLGRWSFDDGIRLLAFGRGLGTSGCVSIGVATLGRRRATGNECAEQADGQSE